MKKFLKILGIIIIILVVISIFMGESDSSSKEATIVQVGQPLTTRKFDITVNNLSINKTVSTGNQFVKLDQKDGINYLVINLTYKNVDSEARTFTSGNLIVKSGEQTFKFDKAETLLLDGWGGFKQINPMISSTTNIVYAIPADLKNADLYYHPSSAPKNNLIFLGHLE